MKRRFTRALLCLCGVLLFAGLFFMNSSEAEAAHTHSYKGTRVVDPTCTSDGAVYGVCSCGAEKKVSTLTKKGHSLSTTTTVYPTCKSTGKSVTKCSRCPYSYSTTLSTIAHDKKGTSVDAATCTTSGAVWSVCSMCGARQTKVSSTSPTGHSWSETSRVAAKCLTDGKINYKCTNKGCSATKSETIKAPMSHGKTTSSTTPATCTRDGSITTVCSTCGASWSSVIKATGHNQNGTSVDAATCTSNGAVWSVCTNCNTRQSKVSTLYATGHNWVEKSRTEATCTSNGKINYRCSNPGCSATTSETITAHHSYKTVYEYHCETNGIVYNVCSVCGYEVKAGEFGPSGHDWNSIDKCNRCGKYKCAVYGHSYSSNNHCTICGALKCNIEGHDSRNTEVVEATCTREGAIWSVCSVCGQRQSKVSTLAKAEHTYVEYDRIPAKCVTDGKIYYKCSNPECGKKKEEIIKAPMSHGLENLKDTVIKYPSCTETGEMITTCLVCGESWGTILSKKDHVHSQTITVDATCTKDGAIYGECECGDRILVSVIQKTGHHMVEDKSKSVEVKCLVDGHKYYYCDNPGCKETSEETIKAKMSHGDANLFDNIIEQPTCTTRGKKETTCRACGEKWVTVLEKTDHDFPSNTAPCTGCGKTKCEIYGHDYTDKTPCTRCGVYKNHCFSLEENGKLSCNSTCKKCHKALWEHSDADLANAGIHKESVYHAYVNWACKYCGKPDPQNPGASGSFVRMGLDKDFIQATDDNGTNYFGGAQDWFENDQQMIDYIAQKDYAFQLAIYLQPGIPFETADRLAKAASEDMAKKALKNTCGIVASINTYMYLSGKRATTKDEVRDMMKTYIDENWAAVSQLQLPEIGGVWPTDMCAFLEKHLNDDGMNATATWKGLTDDPYEYIKRNVSLGIPTIMSYNNMAGEYIIFYAYDPNTQTFTSRVAASSHYFVATGVFEQHTADGDRRFVEVSTSVTEPTYIDYDEYVRLKGSSLFSTILDIDFDFLDK